MHCQCGCGGEAPIAKLTRRGYRKGDRMRFIQGHHLRVDAYKAALHTPERNAQISAAHADGRIPNPPVRHGSASPRWRGDEVGYAQMHLRLAKARGAASQHACHRCGEPAAEWALDHSHDSIAREERGGRIVPFSRDLNAYVPLCRGCHRRADANGGYRG